MARRKGVGGGGTSLKNTLSLSLSRARALSLFLFILSLFLFGNRVLARILNKCTNKVPGTPERGALA